MSAAPARIVLSGYYGFDNFGDEAILRVFLEQWRLRRPADAIAVLSRAPEQTAAAYGVTAVRRSDMRAVVQTIRDCDLLVSGGGGLLQNATSLRSLLYYTGIVREAKHAGRKAAIFAQGVGPLDFIGKQVVKRTCGDVDLALVRDRASAALLQPLIPRVPVQVTADPVFLAPRTPDPSAAAVIERDGIASAGGPLVTVVVRKSSVLERIARELASGIDRLTIEHGARVIFVPFQRPDDAESAIAVIRRCKTAPTLLDGGYDLPAMTALFARSAAVISMRLHALILAAVVGVPFLAIPYDPKVTALLEELAYPLPPLERGAAASPLFDRLMSDAAALSATLKTGGERLRALAAGAFDRLAALAGGQTGFALKQTP